MGAHSFSMPYSAKVEVAFSVVLCYAINRIIMR